MAYKIIDNLLTQEDLSKLQQHMMGEPQISWTYNPHVNTPGTSEPFDFQFTHTFYLNSRPVTAVNLVDPILMHLNPSALVRIKANLMTRTNKLVIHDYHQDHPYFDGKIAIFYVNTNDGYTMFKDGTKIESLENRLVIFDGNILHTGTSCTDQKVRCLINFMYYQWTDNDLWKL